MGNNHSHYHELREQHDRERAALQRQIEEADANRAALESKMTGLSEELMQLNTTFSAALQRSKAEAEAAAAEAAAARRRQQQMEAQLQQFQSQLAEAEKAAKEAAGRKWAHMPPSDVLEQAMARCKEAGYVLDPNRFNIAFVGPTGSGKSSLLNALLSLMGAPECRAPVSAINEGTIFPKPYPIPGTPFTLWDMPGAGTQNFQVKDYIDQFFLAVFQMQIVFSAGRPEEVHVDLLQALKSKYPCQDAIFVVARGDELLSRMRYAALMSGKVPRLKPHSDMLEDARSDLSQQVTEVIQQEDVFVICAMVLGGLTTHKSVSLGGPLDECNFLKRIMDSARSQNAVMGTAFDESLLNTVDAKLKEFDCS